ncbi:Uncharacterised protein [Vibrio cholerae]|nr:Uncharacterised protein [Vibrio cholerae]CSB12042.1 Uncharacterised protein [Vibrio cholerae]CSC17598.1 Uncharacterised protein [Vibrio cholerae]CSI74294.1 Uncharacterised protein [Vibrio cholerae]CSI78065.1 Uncharacterised protein [Vibrio cholerae]
MIRGDVVTQNRQWSHRFQGTRCSQRPFPIRWTANIRAHRPPVIQRRARALCLIEFKHLDIDLLELLRLDRAANDGINLFITWP